MLAQQSARCLLAVLLVGLMISTAWVVERESPVGNAQSPIPSQNRGILVASIADAVSFHPYLTGDTASRHYQSLVYTSGLVRRDPWQADRWLPNLAERWEVSADGTTYTFHLRPDLRWSDGQPMTAADFAWTYEQVRRPESGYLYSSNLEPIISYIAPTPATIVVQIREPLAVGLEIADGIQPLPKHVWERLDWRNLAQNPEIMAPTVGSGPFRLERWSPLEFATFVPNEHYFRGRPRLERYTVVITNEPGLDLMAEGLVDHASLTLPEIRRAKRIPGVSVYEWTPAAPGWSYVGFNLRQPTLQDVRVRRAIAHAIDRQAILTQVFDGIADLQNGPYATTCWCYNPRLSAPAFDPARARALLDEAGWSMNRISGQLERDGAPLRLRLLFGPSSNQAREDMSALVRDNLRRLGVSVEVLGLSWPAYLDTIRTAPFDWDLAVSGWTSTVDPYWMHQIWSREHIPALIFGAYSNPHIESLFDQAARSLNPEQRRAAYFEIQEQLVTDAPYVFLVTHRGYAAYSARIGGIEPSPLGLNHNIERWYAK